MKTALVGCGKVGGLHGQALASLPQSELVAVVDSSRERAEAFAAKYGGKPYASVSDAVERERAQAVFLCTPHPLHADAAIEAMDHGAHVLVEKPLAASLDDCDRMLAAAERNKMQLGVVSQRRLYPPVRRMKDAIDAGKIGSPVLGTVAMYSWRDEAYYRSDPWRGKWETEGGGVLINQSPHHLDILQWLMGPVTEISGVAVNVSHPYIEVEDTAIATLRFVNGGVGSVVVSLSQKPGLWTKIHIHGANGASIGAETDSGATFVAGMSGQSVPPFNDIWTVPGEAAEVDHYSVGDLAVHFHTLEIAGFLDALIEGRPVPVPGVEGRKVVQIIDAIYRSSRERRVVEF